MRGLKVLLSGLLLFHLSTSPLWAAERRQIIVLPFRNLSQQAADQWLSESFSENLLAGMGREKSLRMIERGEIQQILKEQAFMQSVLADTTQAPQLGKILGAEYIVIGSFQRLGQRLQASVRLVNVETGEIDGSSLVQVEGELDDLFGLQARLAQQLLAQLNASQQTQLAELQQAIQTTTSPQAHEYYLKGLSLISPWMTDRDLENAVQWFQQAIQADTRYVNAYAGLAEVYARRALGKSLYASARADDAAQALTYAQQAYQLDPESAESYYALSLAYQATQQEKPAQQAAEIAAIKSSQPRFIRHYLEMAFPYSEFESKQDKLDEILKRFSVDANDPVLQEYLSSKYLVYLLQHPTLDHGAKISGYQQAFDKNPRLVLLGISLATMYLVQGQRAAFEQILSRLEQVNQDNALGLYTLGIYVANLNQQGERALQLLNRAIELQPRMASFYLLRAHIYQAQLQPGSALADIQQALTLSPEVPNVLYQAARIYVGFQRDKESEQFVRKAIRLNQAGANDLSAAAQYQALLGGILKQQGRLKEALAAYQLAVTNPQVQADSRLKRMYLRDRSQVFVALKDYDSALLDLKQALELSTEDSSTQAMYKLAYLLKALEAQPDDPLVLNDLGQAWLQDGKTELAIESLNKAQQRAPQNASIAYNLGLAYQSDQQWKQAQAAFDKALNLEPGHTKARLSLAKLAYQQGQMQSVQTQLQVLLAEQPDLIGALELQALLLEAQNKLAEARTSWLRILKLDPEHVKARRESRRLETAQN